MANCVIINALGLSPLAVSLLHEAKSALDFVSGFVSRLPEVDSCTYIVDPTSEKLPERLQTVSLEGNDIISFLNAVQKASEGYQHIFYLFADCPLYDTDATLRMYANHVRYYAQYTFADGYPLGLTPEIVRADVLPRLITLAGEDRDIVKRSTVFDIIQKDINSFDIETDLAPKDLRMLRATLACDSRRNTLLTQRVMKAGGMDAGSVIEVLENKPEVLRTLPAFANIQIVDGCPQACSYCPFPLVSADVTAGKDFMPLETITSIAHQVADYSGDAVLSVSLWGEPALHPDIYGVIDAVGDISGLSLVIETSGIGWSRDRIMSLTDQPADSCTWIVSLDASNEADYQKLRGPGWDEASATAAFLIDHLGSSVFIQAVRMNENEANLEGFYRYWKEKTDNVIIQKYDSFAGFLPERKVTDLSPLKRNPCWHLQRDLTVLLDGTVTMCREDLSQQHVLGNMIEEELSVIWDRGEKAYRLHLSEEYPEICSRCDEYYTYNF